MATPYVSAVLHVQVAFDDLAKALQSKDLEAIAGAAGALAFHAKELDREATRRLAAEVTP